MMRRIVVPALAALVALALAPTAASALNLLSGQTFDGGGGTLLAPTCRDAACAAITVPNNVHDVTIRNIHIKGACGGTFGDGSYGRAAAIRTEAAYNIHIGPNVTVDHVCGDAVDMEGGYPQGASGLVPTENIAVDGLTSDYVGRNGATMAAADSVIWQNNRHDHTGLWQIDLEPDRQCDMSDHNVTIRNNDFGEGAANEPVVSAVDGNFACSGRVPFEHIVVQRNRFRDVTGVAQEVGLHSGGVYSGVSSDAKLTDNCMPNPDRSEVFGTVEVDGYAPPVTVARNGPASGPCGSSSAPPSRSPTTARTLNGGETVDGGTLGRPTRPLLWP
jgi:hypothetical protein